MLVLSRQTGERLIIDGNIEVTVVEIRPDRVKLGIVAPPEVSVHREEVFRRIVASAVTLISTRWGCSTKGLETGVLGADSNCSSDMNRYPWRGRVSI